jgi:hypothetical protein
VLRRRRGGGGPPGGRQESARARQLSIVRLVGPRSRPEPVHAAADQWASVLLHLSSCYTKFPLLFLPPISGHGTGSRSRDR